MVLVKGSTSSISCPAACSCATIAGSNRLSSFSVTEFSPQVLPSSQRGAVTAFGAGTMIPVAIYGGFFNGGLGIVLLALFSMWGMTNLHAMNGLKCWLSFALSVVSMVIFSGGGKVVWIPALVMGLGTILGGLAGAPVARRIPMPVLRKLIAAVGFGMTAVFLYRLF